MRTLLVVVLLQPVVWLLGSCTANPANPSGDDGAGQMMVHPGQGKFTVTWRDRQIPVFYDAPSSPLDQASVLIVMPGVQRNAAEYRDDWVPLIGERPVIVLVPQLSENDFPGAYSYNLGGMVDAGGNAVDPARWTFNVVDQVFDRVVRHLGSTATTYSLFGHSAGAQFVDRLVVFAPSSRVRVAAAANPGWYTATDDNIDFPYGLNKNPLDVDGLAPSFRVPLVVMLGNDDVDPENDTLRRDAGSDAQGDNRLERGLNFYIGARKAARDESMAFAWRLIVVPGVAHDHAQMAKAAEPVLLGPP